MAMVKVFETPDLLQAHFVRTLLAGEGIRAFVLGEHLQAAIGGVPALQGALPEVWVGGEDQADALDVIDRYQKAEQRKVRINAAPWVCPKCGERIEGQFSECWKCGTSRPHVGGDSVEPQATVGKYLDIEVLCTHCEYNLLGLEPGGKCPECGRAIVLSMLAIAKRRSPELSFELDPLTQFIDRTLEQSGYTADAVLFLIDAWPRALKRLATENDTPKVARAIEVCWRIADITIEEFDGAAEAMAAFRAWGFHDCQSLGASLIALIARGWLEATDQFALEDFPSVPIESIFPPNEISDVEV